MAADSPAADPSTAGPNDDVADLSYEAARDELVHIVAQLEGGQVSLEESMRLWQRGESLAAHCESWLVRAEAAVTTGAQDPASPQRTTGSRGPDPPPDQEAL